MNKGDGNQLWKSIAVVFGGLLLVWLVFNQTSAPVAPMIHGHMGAAWGTTASTPSLFSAILGIAWNLLWLVLVIGLIGGVFQIIKRFLSSNNLDVNLNQELKPISDKFKSTKYNCPECKENLDEDFKFCPKCKTSLNSTCSKCGKILLANWRCCPACGLEKNVQTGATETEVAGDATKAVVISEPISEGVKETE